MKKVAIPTRENKVDNHFGHCDYYTIYEISEDNSVVNTSNYEAPKGCGCKSGVGNKLANKGVTVLLAGSIGRGAVEKVSAAGIQVIKGCEGEISAVIEAYLQNKLQDSGETCDHTHGDDHQCENH